MESEGEKLHNGEGTGLPSLQEAVDAKVAVSDVDRGKARELREGIKDTAWQKAKIKGLEDFFADRKKWSGFILCWISVLIAFNVILTIGVGSALLDFSNMQWFVTAITAETFLQIVGLGYVAARYLFSDSSNK